MKKATRIFSWILAAALLLSGGAAFASTSVQAADAEAAAAGYVHNFTTDGKTSSFYSITGNLSTIKGTVNYDGKTLTQCLKIETATRITFTAPSAGTLTLVFVETSTNIKLDGTKYAASSNVMVLDVTAGAHTVSKDRTMNLFYMVYAPAVAPHPCVWNDGVVTTPASCTTDGVKTFTCTVSGCGKTKTETISSTGHTPGKAATCIDPQLCTLCGATLAAATGAHSYTGGACSVCGALDPALCSHSHKVTVNAQAASCTAPGYSGDTYCNDCKTTIATGSAINASGHAPGEKATCTTAQACTVCGAEITAPLGHNFASGSCTVCGQAEPVSSILQEGGWFETAYAVWEPVYGASGYNVYVQASGASAWTKLDAMLVREYPGYWRADALGLKAGSYILKVVPVIGGVEDTANQLVTGALKVIAHDRSGYGFVSGASLKGGQTVTTSSGAYNDDGTLKSNAVVIYVTNDNKNTVTATIGGATYTGLSNILAGSVLKKASTPICVRLIGNITDLASGTAFDKGDLLIDNSGNSVGLTIEGVGYDATCNGFGIRIKNSSNVEIRNLAVMNCDSSEGDNIGLQQTNDHIWVHNCDLFYGDAGSDADQAKGDGALDTKKSHYITHSYNHFWDTGKSNLQGGSTSDTSDNITYHHNWYDHSDSRHPRVRVATVHVYNNYYDGVSKYGIGSAYRAEVISEGNYFRNTHYPMMISLQGSDDIAGGTFSGETGGTLTSYNDYVLGATSWIPNVSGIQGATAWSASDYDCVIVNTKYTAYSYTLQSPEEAKASVQQYAGRINHGDFIWHFNNAVDDTSYDVNTALKSALKAYEGSVISAGGVKITSGTGGNGGVSGGATPGASQGAALCGSYKSFGSAGDGLTIQLFASGSEKAAYTFTNASAPANSGSWRIEGVAPGAYTLKVMKKNHVTREYPLTVSSGEASLDVEIWPLGDVNGDGLVNFSDYSKVLSQSKKPNSQILADYAFLCGDVNADGNINFSDYSKVLSQAKGKGSLWQ